MNDIEMNLPITNAAVLYIICLFVTALFVGSLYGAMRKGEYEERLIQQCEAQYARECELSASPRGEW